MIRRWGFRLEEIESMIPFEREIYMSLIIQELERRNRERND